jgi:hypothetical protein
MKKWIALRPSWLWERERAARPSPGSAVATESQRRSTSIGANSICSFSGLDEMDFEAPVDPGVVQNWGSIPRFVRDNVLTPMGEHPGQACNGHLNGLHG